MHNRGKTLHMHQIRDGKIIRTGGVEFFDFDQQGNQLVAQAPYQVQRGDAFRTVCTYEDRGENVTFGFGSEDEMCMAFMMYYPKINYYGFTPWYCDPTPGNLPACQATVTHRKLEELPIKFGKPADKCLETSIPSSAAFPLQTSLLSLTATATVLLLVASI